tara:strand:- start:3078 stop:3665 length:588 start_codon:yes stop_codon:yes gene_type:complete
MNLSTFPQVSSSEKFGALVGEFCGLIGAGFGKLENYIFQKIDDQAKSNPELKKIVEKTKEAQETISKALYTVGALYNFWYSSTAFLAGVGVGFLASASGFPVSLNSLREGEILGHTAQDSFSGPKTMFTLAALNAYLGDTMLDNMFFGSLGGLLVGNSLYHTFKDSPIGKQAEIFSSQAEVLSALALNNIAKNLT